MGALLEVQGHSRELVTVSEVKRNCMRVRAIELKQWKTSGTIYRELKARGANEDVARQVSKQKDTHFV